MDFSVKYKIKEDGDVKEFVVKSTWFNENLDDDYIADEIYEYIYVNMDSNGFDTDDNENMDNIHFINRDQVVQEISEYFQNKRNS